MIMHLDMDAFFASVEQLDNPGLLGKPVIIGGGERGVVSTASYEARVHGIHSAMPMALARKLCPNAIYIHGNYKRYSELSHAIMDSLRDFSPHVQPASIDEAYLDIAGMERCFADLADLARAVKKAVFTATGGLTCSIGIAPVKFLAKICSDVNKPDGVFILQPYEVRQFLLSLDVEKLPGVGKRMSASLRSFGIGKVGQLQGLSREFMSRRYGKIGEILHDRAMGIDPRQVREPTRQKSEGSENTFGQDTFDPVILEAALARHADRVGSSLRKLGLAGRTITLKIKFSDFRQITRSRTIDFQTNATETIFEIANAMLCNERLPKPVRLIGISVSGFEERNRQLPLPGIQPPLLPASRHKRLLAEDMSLEDRRHGLDRAIDDIRPRFGDGSILRAARPASPQTGNFSQ